MSGTGGTTTVVWFRLDLRLADHPALTAAVANGGAVVPVFVWAPDEERPWPPGAAGRWWLHHSLKGLDAELRRRGSRLIVRRGESRDQLRAVCREADARAVVWSRRVEPAVIQRDARVQRALSADGIATRSFNAGLLFEPEQVRTRQGGPFQVFGAFWRACRALPDPPAPLAAPARLPAPRRWPRGAAIDSLGLLPTIGWAAGLAEAWSPGAPSAERELDRFVGEFLEGYEQGRERPARPATSRLSPHLHFGEISPRQVRHRVGEHEHAGAQAYQRELGWREFAHHLLIHFPHTTDRPLRPEFEAFGWRRNTRRLRAWQRGQTGFPLVDAGMRELWATGWMHNRVRMAAASFLVKDLFIPWQEGAKWFWDTLVDADLANNTLGWQWTAGCGADAAPFFRIFNPTGQGERFDPQGAYVRRWVPELSGLPDAWIHRPNEAPPGVLSAAGVTVGLTYPYPIVDHAKARERALQAFQAIRSPR